MITNPRVLDPEFVPTDVVHREAQIEQLSSVLRPLTDGHPADVAFLHGPTGSGKTCIARFAVERLRRERLDLELAYVNCWTDGTAFKSLYRILEQVDQVATIHRRSTPTDELVDRIRDLEGPPSVVILDEADQLVDHDVLYDLYRVPDLSMVLIANSEEKFFAHLGNRLTSRLRTATTIPFRPYSLDSLIAILETRARAALEPESVDDEGLRRIADAAAGDARIAIEILRAAARIGVDRGADQIQPDIVDAAISEGKAEVRRASLAQLTADQRHLYDIVAEAETIDPGTLYDRYRDRAGDPKSDRMVRKHLRKLDQYGLIKVSGENRGRRYHHPEPK